jgi:hypothetical protein
MWNFLRNLFHPGPKYTLGAEESPIDIRNISIASFQAPVVLPDIYETDMPPVEDQKNKPKCVPAGISKVAELYFKQHGIIVDLSDDDLYAECKKIDGIPDIAGTYPTIGAKIACNTGIASVDAFNTGNLETINASRLTHKMGGYAFVPADYESICQAIYQNKAITASFGVDANWFIGFITKILKSIGRHYVVLHGFRKIPGIIIGQNSWGISWIGRIAGIINSNTKAGHFEMLWSDYADNIFDIIAFTDIPQEILDNAKKQPYYFVNTLRKGSRGYEVQKLQERLNIKADGIFGDGTKQAVMIYQSAHSLIVDGIVGPKMRESLNGKTSKLDLWCAAIKQMEGAKPERNNPGNLRFRNQQYAVNDKGFCKFDTYEHGYTALRNLIIKACTGQSSLYNSNGDLYQFYAVYAPDSDGNNSRHYAEFVAQYLNISPDTKIKYLI